MNPLTKFVIFLSGPYTAENKDSIELNVGKARGMKQQLEELGFSVFCPHTYWHENKHLTYDQVMDRSTRLVGLLVGLPWGRLDLDQDHQPPAHRPDPEHAQRRHGAGPGARFRRRTEGQVGQLADPPIDKIRLITRDVLAKSARFKEILRLSDTPVPAPDVATNDNTTDVVIELIPAQPTQALPQGVVRPAR